MRALAHALGVGPATLYTYVPGKAELLELMVDRVVGAQPLPTSAAGHRAGLHHLATAELAAHRAHPWLLQVATSRTMFGPHVLSRYDAALALPDGCGLAAIEVTACVAAVESYTRGAASAVVEAGAFAVSDTALPYTLQRALDRFAFGLDLLLDSIDTRITAAAPR